MKALISGQAATAVLVDGEQFYSLKLDEPRQVIKREEWEISLLLADADDIQQIDDAVEAIVFEELELAWEKDRGLQLILILLDSQEEAETRLSAAECLNEFLSSSAVSEYIANHLYSAPLPPTADTTSALRLCSTAECETAASFLQTLEEDQDEIGRRHQAWLNLPTSLFGGANEKKAFHFDAVRFGAFHIFATERGKKNWAIVQLLSHPYFRGNARARAVFQLWAAPFKESVTGTSFEHSALEKDLYEEIEEKAQRERRNIRPHEAFARAEKQREAIKQSLLDGNQELALRFTEQLINDQRRNSDPEHIAKSLCDLAQFAKRIGSPELQLEFSKRAITEAPTDAWSYATAGDAYRALTDYQNALASYHQSGVFGDSRAALIGRAVVLKDLGQITNALELFKKCIEEYPDDRVAQNARASALADFGRFTEAIEAYNKIINESPLELDAVTLTGRAQTLKEMGRLDEALEQLDQIIEVYPEMPIPLYTRGAVLRDFGRLDEALETFAELKHKFPLAAEMHAGYARALRDLGQFDQAVTQFNQVIESYSFNPFGYIGLAVTYKEVGDLNKAHDAYDTLLTRFPRLTVGRNGKASIFMAQGQYADAINLLLTPNLPATYNEWVAYHIRAMGYMRAGELERAERMFEFGLKENPWASHRQYFQTALASLRIQQKRYHESLELLKDITNPSVKPIAQVVLMHALGELDDKINLEQAYQSISETSSPVIIKLRNVLASRYIRSVRPVHSFSDSQIFSQECDSLLLAA